MGSSFVRPEEYARAAPATRWRIGQSCAPILPRRPIGGGRRAMVMGMRAPDRKPRLSVHIVALRDCAPIVPVGMTDMLRKTAELTARLGQPGREITIELVAAGPSREVRCAAAVVLRCGASLADVRRSDLVVIPAVDPDVDSHLAANRSVVPWLRRMFEAGAD